MKRLDGSIIVDGIPFTQSTVVHDQLDLLNRPNLLEFSPDVILSNIEEQIADIDGLTRRWRWLTKC